MMPNLSVFPLACVKSMDREAHLRLRPRANLVSIGGVNGRQSSNKAFQLLLPALNMHTKRVEQGEIVK